MWQFWKMHSAIILVCVFALTRSQNYTSEEYSSIEEQIVNGWQIEIGQAPYQVSVRYYDTHICGGSILATDIILTAADCTKGYHESELGIRVGSSIHSKGKYFSIRECREHPKFDYETLAYNIAFLYLKDETLTYGPTVKPIMLASRRPEVGTRLFVTGWGATSDTQQPDKLRGVYVQIMSQDGCRKFYSDRITNDMLCAGYTVGGKDACQGDFGGPLVNTAKDELVGVVSWGDRCGEPKKPAVYTSVPDLHKYLQESTRKFMQKYVQVADSMEDMYYDVQSTYEYT